MHVVSHRPALGDRERGEERAEALLGQLDGGAELDGSSQREAAAGPERRYIN